MATAEDWLTDEGRTTLFTMAAVRPFFSGCTQIGDKGTLSPGHRHGWPPSRQRELMSQNRMTRGSYTTNSCG